LDEEIMVVSTKNWRLFFVGLSFIFFSGQIQKTGVYSDELSVQARMILAKPVKKMKPSIQQELRRAWKKAASPIFQEFLPGLEDKVSYHARIVSVNNNPVILFQATGEKRSPDVAPVSHLLLEVFINSEGVPLNRRFDHGTQGLSAVNDKFEIGGFVADRAVRITGFGEGSDTYLWQKGGHYVEVRSQGDVKSIAQKIQLKLHSRGFYDFSAFLLNKDDRNPPFAVARDLPSQEADRPIDQALPRSAESESGEWVFKGCYKDASSKKVVRRDVFGFIANESDMTNEKCMRHCRTQKYPIAATQFGNWCFCGSGFGSFGEADNCNMRCAGNPKEVCGGRWANSVYKLTPQFSSRPNNDQ